MKQPFMNAVHHHNQLLLTNEQWLSVWQRQVPEQQPKIQDWITSPPERHPTDVMALGESQKQRIQGVTNILLKCLNSAANRM